MKRNIYLSNMDLEEALKIYYGRIRNCMSPLEKQELDADRCVGRVTAEPVFARYSSPNFNAAAMDGIAVISKSTFNANEHNPLVLERGVDFEYINTGYMIHDPYDAVIMIEDIVEIDDTHVQIILPASPWQHIRPIGEDIVAGEMIVPANHKIRPWDLGSVYSAGVGTLSVYEKVKVGIIPTGTEIIEPHEVLKKGLIYESNSRMFAGLVAEYGGDPYRVAPIDDDYDLLKEEILKQAQNNHMVLVNAGSSAGSKDFTSMIIEELGEVIVHGVAIKPGKPTILGLVQDTPVIGIPGYPVSAYFTFETFVKPLIFQMQKLKQPKEETVTATASRRMVSSLKHQEYVRIKLGEVGGKLVATPLSRGAGATLSLVRADGVLIIPRNSEGIEAGENIEIRLLKDIYDIKKTIVSIGSHDLILDILGNLIQTENPDIHLSSAHTGSMGGIMALRRGEAHIAPIHLLDESSGEYNISYIKRYFGNKKMALIKGVKREQGIMTAPGNPKKIKELSDLTKENITFVNRQKGSGTRILTDYLIKKKSINTEDIKGYEREMVTHTSAAASVESGSADVAVGIYSAAKHFGLNFISIGYEAYDFVIPQEYLEMDIIQYFISQLKSTAFNNELEKLGGYEAEGIGEIIIIKN